MEVELEVEVEVEVHYRRGWRWLLMTDAQGGEWALKGKGRSQSPTPRGAQLLFSLQVLQRNGGQLARQEEMHKSWPLRKALQKPAHYSPSYSHLPAAGAHKTGTQWLITLEHSRVPLTLLMLFQCVCGFLPVPSSFLSTLTEVGLKV